MQNISLCNVIDKTEAKYFTQAKYFTVYDETKMCTLCPLYVVNVQKCKIFRYAMPKTNQITGQGISNKFRYKN